MAVSAMDGRVRIIQHLLRRVLMLRSWVQIWSTHAEVAVTHLVCDRTY